MSFSRVVAENMQSKGIQFPFQSPTLVAAIGLSNQLGRDNDLLWRLKPDLQLFRKLTMGRMMIMGRKTWDSIGGKPLPGRVSIVISRTPHPRGKSTDQVLWEPDFSEALCIAKWLSYQQERQPPVCIGGGAIYAEAMPYASDLWLTEVDDDPIADTFFPSFDRSRWRIVEEIDLETIPTAVARHYRKKPDVAVD